MLFDLEDYRGWGLIAGYDEQANPKMKAPDLTHWFGPYTTFMAVKQSFYRQVSNYFTTSIITISLEDREKFIIMYDNFIEASLDFEPISKQFWNSLVSLPVKTLVSGQKFNIINEYQSQISEYLSESNEKYPDSRVDISLESSKYQVYPTETGLFENPNYGQELFVYTEFSKVLEKEYLTSLKNVMSTVKILVEACYGEITDV
jgi:hypothetical protein